MDFTHSWWDNTKASLAKTVFETKDPEHPQETPILQTCDDTMIETLKRSITLLCYGSLIYLVISFIRFIFICTMSWRQSDEYRLFGEVLGYCVPKMMKKLFRSSFVNRLCVVALWRFVFKVLSTVLWVLDVVYDFADNLISWILRFAFAALITALKISLWTLYYVFRLAIILIALFVDIVELAVRLSIFFLRVAYEIVKGVGIFLVNCVIEIWRRLNEWWTSITTEPKKDPQVRVKRRRRRR